MQLFGMITRWTGNFPSLSPLHILALGLGITMPNMAWPQAPPTPDTDHLRRMLYTHEVLTFELIEEVDPYTPQESTVDTPHAHTPVFLRLSNAQRFVCYSATSEVYGRWEWRTEDGNMNFFTDTGTGHRVSTRERMPDMQLASFTPTRLTLNVRGRHGYVKRVYRLISKGVN